MARKTVKKKTGNKKKGEKSSVGKLFLILFLLLLFTAIAVGAYLYFTGEIDQYLGDEKIFEQTSDEMQTSLPDELKQPESQVEKIAVEPPIEKPKPTSNRQSGRYLLQLGDCFYKACVTKYSKAIKKAGQRLYKKQITNKTKYYELISEEKFTFDRANDKIRIIDNYKKIVGTATTIRTDDGYYITFGQYPDHDLANKTLAYIDQFSGDVKIRFKLVPRSSTYKATRVYAGPYSSKKSANYAKKQLENLEEIKDAVLTTR
jgi:cell division septation protein DedD